MGVGAGLYMYDVVVKKVDVRYLISWWVFVYFVFESYVRRFWWWRTKVNMAWRTSSSICLFMSYH